MNHRDCPVCGTKGDRWEYGVWCSNYECPVRELNISQRDPSIEDEDAVTVVVDPETAKEI